ncbi:MAG: hypothetical protein EAZ97_13045 [Bacteroidetes bacterium]|nr:MAG: hypothetical protein EAZ97_13045 [Bacteroidota bacterium]
MRSFFCFVLLIINSLFVFSQNSELIFEQLSVEDGLSQNDVFCIFQDRKGLLWLGTQDGLNRYNGYEFKIFKHHKADSLSISNSFIRSIVESKDGKLWIATNSGLNLFDRKTEQFKRYKSYPNQKNHLIDNQLYNLLIDKQDFLWIATAEGISKFDYPKNIFTSFLIRSENEEHDAVYSLFQTRKGVILAGTANSGLQMFDSKNNTFVAIKNEKYTVKSIYEDPKGLIWLGTNQGLKIIDLKDQTYHHNTINNYLSSNEISSIIEDSDQNIWLGTLDGGIDILKNNHSGESNYEVQVYRNTFNEPKSLSRDHILPLFMDKAGSIWIGTASGGVNIYDEKKYKFRLFQHEINNKNSLNDNFASSVLEDLEGILWIGTKGGLNRYDKLSGQYTAFQFDPKNPNSISDNVVSCILESKNGKIWVGTSNGLNLFDKKTQKFTVFQHKRERGKPHTGANELSDNHIRCLYEDKNGILWIGTAELGLNCFDISKKKFTAYLHQADDPHSLSDNTIRAITEDEFGTIWLGTAGGGLCKFNKQSQTFTAFKHSIENKNSLAHNSVKYLYADYKGSLWIGTHNGLDHFDLKTQKFENYSIKNKLPDNNIHGILQDKNEDLWLSTNEGLCKLELSTGAVRYYDMYDNLQGKEFNNGACYLSKSGEMFFGGTNGLNSFFPEKIKSNPNAPQTIVTDFKIEHSKGEEHFLVSQEISEVNQIKLSHEENTITFFVAALNFRHPEKNQYAFFLEGHDKEWNFTDNKRSITYTNLPTGTYIFRAMGSNNDGIFGKEITPIKIIVQPPFWDTWWFKILIALLIFWIVYRAYQLKIGRIESQKRKLEEIVKERTQQINLQKDKIEQSYENVRVISKIGREITSILHHDMVVDQVFESVKNLMDVSMFRIGVYNPEDHSVFYSGFKGEQKFVPYIHPVVDGKLQLSHWCIEKKEEIVINNFEKEYSKYGTFDPNITDFPRSIIYLPLIVEEELIGILTVQSFHKNAYSEEHINILRALGTYISIALDNSVTYGKLNSANKIIEAKTEHIVSSIRYAERIQQAILPEKSVIKACIPEFFIVFKPKDIVSGDFYWFKRSEKYSYISVNDCTGHGVPGAFMSMIGNTLLNEIVNQKSNITPAELLEQLHIGIRKALKQENSLNDDGMDIVLCRFEDKVTDFMFAGAKQSLFSVSEGKVQEIRGDNKSVGGRQKEVYRTFSNQQISAKKGDMLYLSSDGYIDQNNEKREKFGTKKFIQTIELISNLDIDQQEKELIICLANHQQDQAQRDDITLIGIKI